MEIPEKVKIGWSSGESTLHSGKKRDTSKDAGEQPEEAFSG
jgi:hypothetical protein